jgi:hypothetical protein
MTRNIFLLLFITLSFVVRSQDDAKVYQTFKDTRVINAHSTETLKAGIMDFRIAHRFGDFEGEGGGWETFFGLENASDVMIGFEYGITNNFMIGLNRAKGTGPLKQNVNGIAKIRFAEQDMDNTIPFSLALLGVASGSTMPKSRVEGVINFFEKTAHRFSYHGELILSRKFSNYFSCQVSGAWTYRNIVPSLDKNDLVSIGFASRIQLSKSIGILLDGRMVFSDIRTADTGYYAPLGIGIEWETGGGHVFQLNFTNAKGIEQTDYIPYTTSNWLDGEYRLGFTIARQFRI